MSVTEALKNELILYRGKWVSWEFYKDINGIEEFGY